MQRTQFSWPARLAVVTLTAIAGHLALADDQQQGVRSRFTAASSVLTARPGQARIGLLLNDEKASNRRAGHLQCGRSIPSLHQEIVDPGSQ